MNNDKVHEFTSEYLQTLTHKTPFFLFSKEKILGNYNEFKNLFPGSLIHYAMKANSEHEILRVLSDAGCGFEVASIYELNILQSLNIGPEKIIYGTSVKPAAHISEFVKYGVDKYAFDSFGELEKIAIAAPASKVYVRVIVNDTGSVFKFSEKFGTDMSNASPLLLRARELGVQPYGISFHVGSQASDSNAWAHAIKAIRSVLRDLKEKGIEIEVLNLGGGYPCNYGSSDLISPLHEISAVTNAQYKKLPYQPQLMLEPGRGIVADTGILVATIIARVERQGSTWLFLDAGVYNGLFEAMAYQGSTRYPISSMRKIKDSGESLFALAGPTGDGPDVITREALLPQDIEVGERIIIHKVGAYSLSVTSEFNGFPKPDVYYV